MVFRIRTTAGSVTYSHLTCLRPSPSLAKTGQFVRVEIHDMSDMASKEVIRLYYEEYKHWKHEKFTRFVNNLLLLRDRVDLHTFQLRCESEYWRLLNCNDLRTWIGYAVKQNVKVLDVKLYQYDKSVLPSCIFTSRSLQDLKLDMGKAPHKDYEHEGLVLPDIIKLPSLRRLTLRDVEVYTSALEDIIARSPELEDLHLIKCAQHLDLIDSKVLKRLTVDGFIGRDEGLTIAAPSLIHFECKGWPLEAISWQERPSLESAHIDTCGRTFDGQSDFTGIFLNAKRLTLFGSDIKVMLEKELPTCSVFYNLTTLKIGNWCLMDFNVVLHFLQLSPRLEKLVLKHRKGTTKGAETDSTPIPEMTFQCPLLETVTIQCSKDDDGIKKIVNAMVANGVSSEKIHVEFYEDIKWSNIAERNRVRQEEGKERSILEKILKKRQEWVDDMIDSDNDDDEMGETLGYDSVPAATPRAQLGVLLFLTCLLPLCTVCALYSGIFSSTMFGESLVLLTPLNLAY
ncbi:hypothetical protein EJB05_16701, partial [Eragrostis curvula]